MTWEENACHIDSLIVAMRHIFVGKDYRIYPENSIDRKFCEIISLLDNPNISQKKLNNERISLWNWSISEGFSIRIGVMADVRDWFKFWSQRTKLFQSYVKLEINCPLHGQREVEDTKYLYEILQYLMCSGLKEQIALDRCLAFMHYHLLKCPEIVPSDDDPMKSNLCGISCSWRVKSVWNPQVLVISFAGIISIPKSTFSTKLFLRGGEYNLFGVIYFRSAHYWASFLKEGKWYTYDDTKRKGAYTEQAPPVKDGSLLLYDRTSQVCVYQEPIITEAESMLPKDTIIIDGVD